MISNRICFTVSFSDVPEPVADVWRALAGFLRQQQCLPKSFEVSQIAGHPLQLQSEERLKLDSMELERLITQRNLDGFQVNSGRHGASVSYWLLHAKESGRQSYLWSIIDEGANAPDNWTGLIEGLMTLWPAVGGWQWKSLYEAWQGAPFLDKHYERRYGEMPPGLRTYVQKGVPGVSDRVKIDTSLNPGRPKELLPTIYFYPTAEMWLGPHFWPYAKCTKEEALAAHFFIEKRDTPNYLYLKCWPEPFTRPDGEQGRMQQRLWKLFFHEDCEWPPGSGTICAEPIYGPRELMPPCFPT